MSHVPVLTSEIVHYLLHDQTRIVLDGTVGCGGHARAILDADPGVRVVGVDKDSEALSAAREALSPYGQRALLVKGSYTDLPRLAGAWGKFDGALLDLGVSSLQLDGASRGFSYSRVGPLDMRMSGEGETALEMIVRASEAELAEVLQRFGEVGRAWKIARAIKHAAGEGTLATTADLARAVDSALGSGQAPALLGKVFQAFRIAVNRELDNLRAFLGSILAFVNPGARLVVVSYHSLEDSAVKEFFRREGSDCLCPPRTPICVCGHAASLDVLTRRVVKPSPAEIAVNSRARSARLRAARVVRPATTE
jgi:16S rRNA (cytosine1402-N4)-methyltransferase